MEDWNAKVGKSKVRDGFMCEYGLGKINKNGEILVDFSYNNNMKISSGTFFKKKNERKWTWISPNRETKNEIDHCLINDLSIVKDVSIINRFKFASDHKLGRVTLVVKRRSKYRSYMRNKKSRRVIFPVHQLNGAKTFLSEVLNAKIGLDTGKTSTLSVHEIYELISDACLQTSQNFGAKNKRAKTDDKLTIKIKNLIEEREQLKGERNSNPKQKIELAEICKLVRREIRRHCKSWEESRPREIIEETWSTKKKMRKEQSKGNKLIMELFDSEGKLIKGRDKIINEATKYYVKLYNETEQTDMGIVNWNKCSKEPFEKFIKSEIRHVLEDLKIGKASEEDFIENEFLKMFAEELIPFLQILFNSLPKKGDRRKLDNYRPLSLSADTRKLL